MNRLKCFAVLVAAMLTVSCSNMFQKKVAMPSNETGSSPSLYNILGVEEVVTELRAPAEIIVSLFEYNDRIKVSWSAVAGAVSYRLERAIATEKNAEGDFTVPEESEFDVLVHTKTLYTTSYTDIIISGSSNDPLDYTNEKYGYAYFYRVCAENERGGFEPSEYIVSTKGMLLAPPKNVKASMGEYSDYIEIDWNSAEGASSYEIYRSFYSDGSNAMRIGTSTILHYSDSSVKNYAGENLYYKVLAVSNSGAKSVESPIAMGYTLLPGAPARVTGVEIEEGKGHGDVKTSEGISVKWNEVINTTNSEPIKYSVYRTSSRDSTMLPLKESDVTQIQDTSSLKPNVYYYYYVQAYFVEEDGGKNRGPMSQSGPEHQNPAEGFILSPPPSLSVTKDLFDSSKAILVFAAAIGDKGYVDNKRGYNNNYKYIIYGGETNDAKTLIELKTFTSSTLNASGGNYVVEIPVCNYYMMKTEFNGKTSDETDVIAPSPYAAEDVHVTRAAMISDYSNYKIAGPGEKEMKIESTANTNGVHPVKITWTAPQGGADGGYHVYRSDKIDSGYRKITDTPVMECSYIDANKTAKAGVIYYYKVLSLNTLGQGSNYSVVDTPIVEGNLISLTNGRGYGWGALSVYQWMQEQRKTTVTSQAKLTLMHKPNNMDKLGKESINGDICGTLSYDSHLDGVSGRVEMPYSNYADLYIQNNSALGIYFLFVDGNTNTSANISANGKMDGVITCKGMYPGKVRYDNVEIKGGQAGGGTYGVIRDGIDSGYQEVYWKAGN